MTDPDRAFLEGAALLDFTGRETVLSASGPDAEVFLQRMLSCDLRRATDGEDGGGHGISGTLMGGKGKLIAPFVLLREGDGFLLLVEREAFEPLCAALDRVLILEEVELAEGDFRVVSVQGPSAGTRLGGDDAPLPSDEHAWVPLEVGAERPGLVVRHTRSVAGGWDLLLPSGAADAVLGRLRAEGAVSVDDVAIDRHRVLAGVPRFGVDGTEENLPTEAGYDAAIAYDKGCYAGQEVMARIRTYGHVNRRLCRLRCEGGGTAPEAGAALRSDDEGAKPLGRVTSVAIDPADGTSVALGFVRYRAAEPGTVVAIEGAGTARIDRVIGDPGDGT